MKQRWQTLFKARFDILLYDLTSTYFESEPPAEGLRQYGYSRDKRPDGVQVVIALIVTPEGLPLADEVMAGNTSDKTTLKAFLDRIEAHYGKSERIWLMDRGIPTEASLLDMRQREPPVYYVVGTPRGRLTRLEKALLNQPWEQVREAVEVKLLAQSEELYILVKSHGRQGKERAMRRRKLKRLWTRLQALQTQTLTRDQLLFKLGAAKKEAGRVYSLVDIAVPTDDKALQTHGFTFSLAKDKLRQRRQREGQYLLRSNLNHQNAATLWNYYVPLTEVEQTFKELKTDLSIRPIYHQKDSRIEAHIFVALVAYCLQVTLKQRLRGLAPGLTPRAVLEKFAAMHMVDVHLPTTDGRAFILARYTHPERDLQLLLKQLQLRLPEQPPPKIGPRPAVAMQGAGL